VWRSILEKTRFLGTCELKLAKFSLFCDIIKTLKKIAQKKAMSEITLDETKLKELLKAAIFELLKEQKEVFSEILTEALEDIGMENAIKEGANTETVSRDQIFKILIGI
jgi:RecG-like helicase